MFYTFKQENLNDMQYMFLVNKHERYLRNDANGNHHSTEVLTSSLLRPKLIVWYVHLCRVVIVLGTDPRFLRLLWYVVLLAPSSNFLW